MRGLDMNMDNTGTFLVMRQIPPGYVKGLAKKIKKEEGGQTSRRNDVNDDSRRARNVSVQGIEIRGY